MSAVQDPAQLFEDLVNIEMVAMLNEAFCELHHKPYCPPSEELTRECGKVRLLTQLHHYVQHAMTRRKHPFALPRHSQSDLYLTGSKVTVNHCMHVILGDMVGEHCVILRLFTVVVPHSSSLVLAEPWSYCSLTWPQSVLPGEQLHSISLHLSWYIHCIPSHITHT